MQTQLRPGEVLAQIHLFKTEESRWVIFEVGEWANEPGYRLVPHLEGMVVQATGPALIGKNGVKNFMIRVHPHHFPPEVEVGAVVPFQEWVAQLK